MSESPAPEKPVYDPIVFNCVRAVVANRRRYNFCADRTGDLPFVSIAE